MVNSPQRQGARVAQWVR